MNLEMNRVFKQQPMSTKQQQAKAPPEIRHVVSFLRSGSAGMKVRVGALNGKRIDYFKGSYFHFVSHPPNLHSPKRQIRNQSPSLSRLCKTQIRPQGSIRIRSTSLIAFYSTVCVLSSRRTRWPLGNLFFFAKTPLHNPGSSIHSDGLLCLVLRRFAVDYVCRWLAHGSPNSRRSDVSVVAPYHEIRRLVSEYRYAWFDRIVFCDRHSTVDILYFDGYCRKSRHLDISKAFCGCWVCKCFCTVFTVP